MKQDTYTHIIDGLKNAGTRMGSLARVAQVAGIDATNITRWCAGTRSPSLKSLAKVMDVIGARIVFPEDIESDFSQDIEEKNLQILELRKQVELLSTQKTELEGAPKYADRKIKELMQQTFSTKSDT